MILPSGVATRVVGWTVSGGFLPLGFDQLNAPRLVVYSDGTAIADACWKLSIGMAETLAVVAAVRNALAGVPTTASPTRGDQMVMDAGTTYLEVLEDGSNRKSVAAYALEVLEYPRPLHDAHARLTALAQRVRDEGFGYTVDRVRVVAVSRPDTNTVLRWPDSVSIPPIVFSADPAATIDDVRVAEVSGPAAQALAAAVPREAGRPGTGQWPVLRTKDAGNLAVAWRYLLPDE